MPITIATCARKHLTKVKVLYRPPGKVNGCIITPSALPACWNGGVVTLRPDMNPRIKSFEPNISQLQGLQNHPIKQQLGVPQQAALQTRYKDV